MIGRVLITCLTGMLLLVGSAQAGDTGIDPVPGDGPIIVDPGDEPVVIDPIPGDGPVIVDPIPGDEPIVVDPPLDRPSPESHRLRLWLSLDGIRVRRLIIDCGQRCAIGEVLIRITRQPTGRFCKRVRGRTLRAGGFYRGMRIGTFRQTNTCQMKRWHTVAPIYRHYFAAMR